MGDAEETGLGTVLLVDDDREILDFYESVLRAAGFETYAAGSAEEARQELRWERGLGIDAVLLDLRMPGESGLEFLRSSRPHLGEIPVVVATTSARVEDAVAALKLGAFDYLSKPIEVPDLVLTMTHAVERRQMIRELSVRRALDPADKLVDGDAVFASPAMRAVLGVVDQVADSAVPIMVLGESGTGKEVLARTLHRRSRRAERPFVAVNCAAIPTELVESELFGHEKGSFTGASSSRQGRFEQARGGTLLLDEVGDLDLSIQAKLLRVLQEKEFYRVGGSAPTRVEDVRVVVATHRDLDEEVRQGRFRQDLLYRLDVITIRLPPLRERREEIPVLVHHLLDRFVKAEGIARPRFSESAIRALQAQDWPGNVRELENVIKRTCLLGRDEELTPEMIRWESAVVPTSAPPASPAPSSETPGPVVRLKDLEAQMMMRALAETRGNVSEASRRLGISRATFYRKASRYGLPV